MFSYKYIWYTWEDNQLFGSMCSFSWSCSCVILVSYSVTCSSKSDILVRCLCRVLSVSIPASKCLGFEEENPYRFSKILEILAFLSLMCNNLRHFSRSSVAFSMWVNKPMRRSRNDLKLYWNICNCSVLFTPNVSVSLGVVISCACVLISVCCLMNRWRCDVSWHAMVCPSLVWPFSISRASSSAADSDLNSSLITCSFLAIKSCIPLFSVSETLLLEPNFLQEMMESIHV